MSLFKIEIKAGNPATFSPNPQPVSANDSVFWYNSDPKNAHWPAPSLSNPTGFLDYQIPPGAESNQISLDPPAPYDLDYVCAVPGHSGEAGVIKVRSGKKKGAFGHKTKKGAFGSTTK